MVYNDRKCTFKLYRGKKNKTTRVIYNEVSRSYALVRPVLYKLSRQSVLNNAYIVEKLDPFSYKRNRSFDLFSKSNFKQFRLSILRMYL